VKQFREASHVMVIPTFDETRCKFLRNFRRNQLQ
jgi:hypothetical protein